MTKSEIRNIVITGSYMIGENGMTEPAHGWKWYAEKLEDILIANNGTLSIVKNLDKPAVIKSACPDCNGKGWTIPSDRVPYDCEKCNGTGQADL